MSANGRLRANELTRVQGDIFLSNRTANAYFRAKAFFATKGITLTIAKPVGGMRTYAVQADMHVHPGRYGLNPNSSVRLAAAGMSSHGWGTRVDVLFNGGSWPTAQQLGCMAKFGFIREFGSADPNHFKHDGRTAITRMVVKVVKKATGKKVVK